MEKRQEKVSTEKLKESIFVETAGEKIRKERKKVINHMAVEKHINIQVRSYVHSYLAHLSYRV